MAQILRDGSLIASVDPDNLTHWLEENDLTRDQVQIRYSPQEQQQQAKMLYADKVGDVGHVLELATDAIVVSLDTLVQDLVTINQLPESDTYRQARIQVFEGQYGAGSWASSVGVAQRWYQGRVSGKVAMPIDIKGLQSLFNRLLRSGRGGIQVLQQMQSGALG